MKKMKRKKINVRKKYAIPTCTIQESMCLGISKMIDSDPEFKEAMDAHRKALHIILKDDKLKKKYVKSLLGDILKGNMNYDLGL